MLVHDTGKRNTPNEKRTQSSVTHLYWVHRLPKRTQI